MTPNSEIGCVNCAFCKQDVPAKLVCTEVVDHEARRDTVCWCICPECKPIFDQKVVMFYKGLL